MMKGWNVWWWCRVEIIACDEEKRGWRYDVLVVIMMRELMMMQVKLKKCVK